MGSVFQHMCKYMGYNFSMLLLLVLEMESNKNEGVGCEKRVKNK